LTDTGETLELARCGSCQARFLPNEGSCPRCASTAIERYTVSGLGKVVAATELEFPAEGWRSPHVLALIELPDAVRLLAIVEGGVPAVGSVVSVRRDGQLYRAHVEPDGPVADERGEGESPRTG